jgi:hypothetical protein
VTKNNNAGRFIRLAIGMIQLPLEEHQFQLLEKSLKMEQKHLTLN